ncbi:MAG TPA: arylsulfatase [Pirellulales bacterium]|nr:arylsulfatase [Pirellulales bacterium]
MLKRLVVAVVVIASFIISSDVAWAVQKPNIVVILSDDYGWGSVGCYGAPSELKTPALDRLAHEGRRFTNAYAPGSVCSPTRYGLMTGRYYWRTSIKDGEVLAGNAPLHIETDRMTLGSLCKAQGYRTAAFGKWHLGLQTGVDKTDWSKPLTPGPQAIGFDYFFGLAANPWNGPHSYIEDDHIVGRIPGEPVVISGNKADATTSGIAKPWQEDHIMGALTKSVTGWIEANHTQPFMVYYAPNAIHEPIVPNPKFKESSFGKYGDFIEELDWSVGQVLETLDRLKIADNTLVIFSSDNGGVANVNNPNAAYAIEHGLPVNGRLRGGKHDIWEGGFREPFLVRWPQKVPAGTVSDQVVCLTDVLATLASIVGVTIPADNAEDSLDISRALFETQSGAPVRDHVILQDAHGVYAVRMGDWKLIERVDPPKIEHRNKRKAQQAAKAHGGAKHDELFNLASDPSEANDVQAAHADVIAKLRKVLASGRDATHTRPE